MNTVEAVMAPSAVPMARRWAPENYVLVAFSGAVLLILVLAGLADRALRQSESTVAWVEHTHAVLHKIQEAQGALSTVRTNVQAYVITGDERYLAQREGAVSAVISSVQDLKEMTADNPLQRRRAEDLDHAMRAMMDRMTMMLVQRQTRGFGAAQALYASGANQALTANIDRLQQALIAEETRLLDQRTRAEVHGRHVFAMVAGALIAVVIATVFVGFACLRREIEARRRLAVSHAAQEHFLETVLDHLPALVWVKDPRSLRIVTMNRAMERWVGRPRDQVIGRTTEEIFSAGDARVSIDLDRQALARHEVVTTPVDTRTASNGTPVTLHTRKVAVRDAAGQPLCVLCIADDISEKVADEQRIRELNATLEAQKAELEAANHELESFSYSVSHDLRSPLRAIDGFSLMLLEDYGPGLDAEAQRYLTTIRAGTQRMGQLIDDLLAFSRIGRQALKELPVDMDALAHEAAAETVRGLTTPVPQIVVSSLPPARGDRSLLQEVWQNLIGNAVKYSSKVAAPKIEVSARREGDDVVYSVRDNGAGFDMQFVHKIFKVFQRLHGQDEFPGTGVGLAIVYRIVTRHGGRIWAESSPGQGATFHFTVPGAVAS